MFDISEFIIAVYLCVDLHLESLLELYPPRARGFAPRLSDSEILTLEIVGEFLGRHSDSDIWKIFPSPLAELVSRSRASQHVCSPSC